MKEHQKLYRLVTAALFAAAIAVMTAYMLHIPIPTGGYIHIGDALIYLAACLLPAPWAMAAGAVGAGLADLLTYTDKESMEKSLQQTQEVFKSALEAAVKERLRGKTPEGLGGGAKAENTVKDQIAQGIRGGMM